MDGRPAAKAGLAAFARLVPNALFALPSGVASDRFNRHVSHGSGAARTAGAFVLAGFVIIVIVTTVNRSIRGAGQRHRPNH